jgi:hypothetical protein
MAIRRLKELPGVNIKELGKGELEVESDLE